MRKEPGVRHQNLDIFYHFTSDLHIEAVKHNGLTRGVTLHHITPDGRIYLVHNTQWITKNPIFNQSWNEFTTLSYRRTDNRITINIPSTHPRLVSWNQFSKQLPPETVNNLNSFGDPENWFIYLGHIPSSWFIQIDKNPCQSVKSVVSEKAVR